MDTDAVLFSSNQNDTLANLQKEIVELEEELGKVKQKLGAFELQIHTKLDGEINRIRELYDLYKKQKRQKKEKRLEQKKNGKNYKEPVHLKPQVNNGISISREKDVFGREELKRLYKRTIIQIHPDKVNPSGDQDKIQKATAITAQLNEIYKSGDLEKLINFYQSVIMGKTKPEIEQITVPDVDNNVRLAALKRKKKMVLNHLNQIKNSYTYKVLTTYENPASFIEELHMQFLERIEQLEKRTRQR